MLAATRILALMHGYTLFTPRLARDSPRRLEQPPLTKKKDFGPEGQSRDSTRKEKLYFCQSNRGLTLPTSWSSYGLHTCHRPIPHSTKCSNSRVLCHFRESYSDPNNARHVSFRCLISLSTISSCSITYSCVACYISIILYIYI